MVTEHWRAPVKQKIGSLMVVLILVVQGCGGNGDSSSPGVGSAPPPPPPPVRYGIGGLWTGALFLEARPPYAGGAMNVRALVAETGEFRLVLAEDIEQWFTSQSEQMFGTFEFDYGQMMTTGDAIWAAPLTTENSAGELFGAFAMWGTYGEQSGFRGSLESWWTTSEERVGTIVLTYHRTGYEMPSSLEFLRGTYGTDTESMSINAQGAMFYQSATSGCTGNGKAEVIDPNYNMYRIEIEVGSCTGVDAVRNGRTFTGLANIGLNNEPGGGFINWTLDMAVSAPYVNSTGQSRFLSWNLGLHEQ
jgi:hypothetical protein